MSPSHLLSNPSISKISEIENKLIQLKGKKFVLKAQIHAGGRGKAGGVKLVNSVEELKKEAKNDEK